MVWDNRFSRIPQKIRSLENEPGFIEQTRWSGLVSDYYSLGTHGIALDRSDSIDYFKLYCEATLEVFKRRGTIKNEFGDAATPEGIVGPPPDQKIDYSLTNSKCCLKGVLTALGIGEFDLAIKIGLLAGDPPNATYISERSETCRPYDSNIAQCVKSVFEGDRETALTTLTKLFISPKATRGRLLRDGLVALFEKDDEAMLKCISQLVDWHKKVNKRDAYNCFTSAEYYFNPWALGLAGWGIHEGLISTDDLTSDYQAFPIGWLLQPS